MKAGKVAYASFTIKISGDTVPSSLICQQINELMGEEKIELEKKTKKKGFKTVDIKPGIKSFELTEKFDYAELCVVLSAGSSDNVNPNLLITALQNKTGAEYDIDITRNDLFDADMRPFR
jgi:ethanolamine utilization protein EutQ (cupin superfamily)